MNENILEKINEQFDFLPHKIWMYISNNFNDRNGYIRNNTLKPLGEFSITTHDRWKKAEEEYNVDCLYGLPKKVFNKIEKKNSEDFINTWNEVLKFVWNQPVYSQKRNYLFLLIRSHLTLDYGYFDIIDTNRLFRVNNETKNK